MRKTGLKRRDYHPEQFPLFRAQAGSHALPLMVDYSNLCKPVDDQGDFNSCVAHALKGILDAIIAKRSKEDPAVSWRAIYAATKQQYEPDDQTDDGLAIEDALNCLLSLGWAHETIWPDDGVTEENLLEVVPLDDLTDAETILSFTRVPITAHTLALALYHSGPLVIGSDWPENWFQVDRTGLLPIDGGQSQGGHCTLIVGYKMQGSRILFQGRNSWGSDWGDGGYYWLPEEALSYVTDAYSVKIN